MLKWSLPFCRIYPVSDNRVIYWPLGHSLRWFSQLLYSLLLWYTHFFFLTSLSDLLTRSTHYSRSLYLQTRSPAHSLHSFSHESVVIYEYAIKGKNPCPLWRKKSIVKHRFLTSGHCSKSKGKCRLDLVYLRRQEVWNSLFVMEACCDNSLFQPLPLTFLLRFILLVLLVCSIQGFARSICSSLLGQWK